MPTFHPLSTEQVLALRKGGPQTKVDLTEYLQFLQEFNPGDIGELKLQEGEARRTIKRRLSMAATQLQKKIRWRSSQSSHNGILRFEVR